MKGSSRGPEETRVLAWLLDPSEPAMRYLASRDLMNPRPSERSLEQLRAEVSRHGWAANILAEQREQTWWATKKTCYTPKFRSTIWQLQVLADLDVLEQHGREILVVGVPARRPVAVEREAKTRWMYLLTHG